MNLCDPAVAMDKRHYQKIGHRSRPKVAPAVAPASVPGATAAGTFDLDQVSKRAFGTGSWHNPVPMIKNWHRLVP